MTSYDFCQHLCYLISASISSILNNNLILTILIIKTYIIRIIYHSSKSDIFASNGGHLKIHCKHSFNSERFRGMYLNGGCFITCLSEIHSSSPQIPTSFSCPLHVTEIVSDVRSVMSWVRFRSAFCGVIEDAPDIRR